MGSVSKISSLSMLVKHNFVAAARANTKAYSPPSISCDPLPLIAD
jgi:hypothetical protein